MDYFLKDDLDALDRKIEEIKKEIKKALREIGDSCQQGAETSHDNPGYEEGQRAAMMWSTHLRQLLSIRQNATIVSPAQTPPPDGKVGMGHLVTIKNLITGEEQSFRIGSAMVFDETGSRISYKSPIGRLLLDAMIGDVLEAKIGNKSRKLLVLDIK